MIDKLDLKKKYCYISENTNAYFTFRVTTVNNVVYQPALIISRFSIVSDDTDMLEFDDNSSVYEESFEIPLSWTIKDVKENYPEKFL